VLTTVALVAALIILCALAAFQISLVAGAPLGHFAWGGQHRVLPATLRRSSIVAVVLYALFAVILLERAWVIDLVPSAVDHVVVWVLVVYLVLATVMNVASKSRAEKRVMTPVSAALLVCAIVVALS
jgi:hypothetical protein